MLQNHGEQGILPDEMERRRLIEQRMREAARRWGYREICTPDFEHLELFTMKSGEGSSRDIPSRIKEAGR